MNDNVRAFVGLVKADPELGRRFAGMSAAELIAAAKERGVALSEADLRLSADELDESELAGASAAGYGFCMFLGGGGGTDSEGSYGCGCVLYGQGGDGRASDANCACVGFGHGDDDNQWLAWFK